MIVVTGATGNIGRHLVTTLAEAGEQVRAIARRPPDTGVPEGVEYRGADLSRPADLPSAVEGADALFLLLGPELSADGAAAAAVTDHARAAGVARLVAVSSQAAATRPDAPSHAGMRALEDAVRGSDLGWTLLRPGGFFSNAFGFAETVRERRTVLAPFGDVALPAIDPADIAGVAAAALRDPRHEGRTYVLTGPEPVSPRQQAAAIGAALGTGIDFVELTRDQAREHLLAAMPASVADGTLDILGAPTEEEVLVGPDVDKVLGRAPRTFADWAARNAAAFR
ncbi:NAD(P)H-binding protein [Nocardiopsis aegyptia]|uniref:NAD(P)H-binding protein n=1 Tax=Nocardiopsis aegyptia TaxID=220378 RepID=UPI00366C08F3